LGVRAVPRQTADLARTVFLGHLRDRNEVLFLPAADLSHYEVKAIRDLVGRLGRITASAATH
jgi:hypothetical protein